MNRLILLGNGFDLAHGMKTSYKDFILSYLKNSFSKMIKNGIYEDELIKIVNDNNAYKEYNKISNLENWLIEDFKKLIHIENIGYFLFDNTTSPFDKQKYTIYTKSELINILISKCSEFNWVDVENEYYNLLCKYSEKNEQTEIKNLNNCFENFQNLLAEYLKSIEENFIQSNNEKFLKEYLVRQLTQPINTSKKQQELIGVNNPNLIPKKILILNFNYTSTINLYYDSLKKTVEEVNFINIHGNLFDNNNPIIFGYGDEEEANFQLLEKFDECLKFVKTYRYLRNDNYSDFLNFINSDKFDVIVLGHSCGLSDKTLLSEVFNNNNCHKIRLLSHNKNPNGVLKIENTDYITKTYQIGRVFKDKALMRKKLIPFGSADLINIRKRQS